MRYLRRGAVFVRVLRVGEGRFRPMASSSSGDAVQAADASDAAPAANVDLSRWEQWEQQDRDDYAEMQELDVLLEFESPAEELASKKGKAARRGIRKHRREHNANALAAARAYAERERQRAIDEAPMREWRAAMQPRYPQHFVEPREYCEVWRAESYAMIRDYFAGRLSYKNLMEMREHPRSRYIPPAEWEAMPKPAVSKPGWRYSAHYWHAKRECERLHASAWPDPSKKFFEDCEHCNADQRCSKEMQERHYSLYGYRCFLPQCPSGESSGYGARACTCSDVAHVVDV